MRFVFVDRVVSAEPRRSIETLKNVSAAEDVFADHFPGYPVFPGAR
jgi:3-hydroxyacyl-[acyl-carrier-protein] dehydratase